MSAYPWATWLRPAYSGVLQDRVTGQLDVYLDLLLRWNSRTNLTSVRTAQGIAVRHFAESLFVAQILPEQGSLPATLLDHGSGAGFPGLPIAILRPEIAVTLSESQHKKAAFLLETVRRLGIRNVTVHPGRTEELTGKFTWVTARAVDAPAASSEVAWERVSAGGWLITSAKAGEPVEEVRVPGSETVFRVVHQQ